MGHRSLIRSFDAHVLEYFLHHDSVRGNVFPDGMEHIDVSGIVADQRNYLFRVDGGVLLFLCDSDKIFRIDCYFLPRKRGLPAKKAIENGIEYMFSVAGAVKIIAEAPSFNAASRQMICSLGFKRTGVLPLSWVKNGIAHDVVVYELGEPCRALSAQ